MKTAEANPKPDSHWAVVAECRFQVIAVSVNGNGFFIPGQQPMWHFNHVQDWLFEVTESTKNDAKIEGMKLAAELTRYNPNSLMVDSCNRSVLANEILTAAKKLKEV